VHIGLIIYGTLDTLSGGYLYDRRLVAELRARGATVEIISLPWRNYAAHLMDNVRLVWLRELQNRTFDLLLQDELNHPSLVRANPILQRRTAVPIVSIVHHLRSTEEHPRPLRSLYRRVEERYLQSVNGFIFNSQTTRDIVLHALGRPSPHVVAVPAADHIHPPDTATINTLIQARATRATPRQLLLVGNVAPRKGVHNVLHALAQLPANNWHLHVVRSTTVDPAYSAAMRHLAQTLGLASAITWHGRVTDAALQDLYRVGDLFVMPSYEGFGIVYLEAMAFGLPVIASTHGAAHEIVTPGHNGALISPDDPRALANVIHHFIAAPEHLRTASIAARNTYDLHPTWQTSMGHAHDWLHEFLRAWKPNL